MTSPGSKKDLSGFARTVDALFEDGGAGPAPEGDEAGEAVDPGEREGSEPDGASDPRSNGGGDPDRLRERISAWIEADEDERASQEDELRAQADTLREAGHLDAVADAVELLASELKGTLDEARVSMGRQLLAPGVASRLAVRLANAQEEDERQRLLDLCGRLGKEMALAVADALAESSDRHSRRVYKDALVVLGEECIDVLERMVEDGRWYVVRNGVDILGEVGGDRAVELITSALAHPEGKVRRAALLSLGKVGGEGAGLLVQGMLEDSDPEVRAAAAMAVGALKVDRAVRPLVGLLETEDEPSVLTEVLRALGQIGDPGAVPAIEKHAVRSFFSRPRPEIRAAAYRALHRIGTPKARRLLHEATLDKDPEIRRVALHLDRERDEPADAS